MSGAVRWQRWLPLAGVAVLAALPMVVSDPYILHLAILAIVFAILASSWDLTLGYGRVFNFAHPVFFAVGAYASAILTVQLGIPTLLGLAIGAVAGAVASAIVFIPVYRVRGNYVALISFAVTQLTLVLVISQRDVTGGASGLVGLPPLALGPIDLASKQASFWVAAALLVVSTIALRRAVASHFGLGLRAAGLFEDYARSRGVPVGRVRLYAFLLSGAIAGAAGALYAHYVGVVSPDLLSFSFAVLTVTMVLVGGVASIYGPIAAAAILSIGSESLGQLGPWRFIIIASIMAATVILAPKGLWGILESVRRRRGRGRAHPPAPPSDAEPRPEPARSAAEQAT